MQISVNAQGRLNSPEAFGEIVLKAEGDRAHAPEGRRAHRARRQHLRDPLAAQQRGRGGDRDLRGARRQHDRAVRGDPRAHAGARGQRSPRTCTGRSSTTRPCSCSTRSTRSIETLLEAIAAGRDRRRAVPADLARVADPAGRGAGVDHRHLRRAVAARLLDQRADAVRPRARDRHRGGRRDRRGRERRAAHRDRQDAARGGAPGDERGVGPDRRDHARARLGVRAARLPRRRHRPVLQAVRGDDRGRGASSPASTR